MASEFDLIARYFTWPAKQALLGVGDDAAVLVTAPGMQLIVSTDMLVSGTHFFPDAEPEALGWKTLAVNVSDMAAMGAQPRWAVLAAALPAPDEAWIAAFAHGFFTCADAFDIDLVGGDTTRGPASFCVTILGEAPAGTALLRSGARAGDDIWISGAPGRAALALAHLKGRCVLPPGLLADCLAALHRPQPRIALGLALRGVASAAIDVSDGLLADLGHILQCSSLAARIELPQLPELAPAAGLDPELVGDCLLAGGDDYELTFTAAPAARSAVRALGRNIGLPLTLIGSTLPGSPGDIQLVDADGRSRRPARLGFDHFRS